jgi:hypothetical protein
MGTGIHVARGFSYSSRAARRLSVLARRTAPRASIATVVILLAGLLAAPSASADTWSGTLALTASRPSYTLTQGPGGIGVTATPSVPAPYYISIYDDTGAQVCSNYAQSYCNTSGYAPVNQSRTYTAYIAQDAPYTGAPSNDVRATATVTVSNQGYINGSLPMTASRPSYTLSQGPGGIGVTATPSVPAPYYISIYDDTGAQVCSNYAQSYCNTSGYAPVGGTRTYTAYIAQDAPATGAPTVDVRAIASTTIANLGWIGSLKFNSASSGSGVTLSAVATPSLPAPYRISLYDDGGTYLGACYATASCSVAASAPPGGSRTYTAYVAQDAPSTGRPTSDVRAFATATVSDQFTTSQTTDGIDQARLAALIDQLDPAAVSEQLLGFTAAGLGTHVLDSSISDQQAVYEAEIAAGKGTAAALKAAALAGGGTAATAFLWYMWTHLQTAPDRPSTPSTTPITTPTPAGPILTFEDSITGQFLQRNPQLSMINAQIAARQCIKQTDAAINAGALAAKVDVNGDPSASGQDPCRTMPIYLPGSTFPETTQHDFEAITAHPEWIRLNYVSRGDRKAGGLQPGWYNGQCGTPTGANQACDEYPFYASAQSGPGASLKFLDATDNSGAGGLYGSYFVQGCKLTSGGPGASPTSPAGTAFLVIPMAFNNAPPTLRVCKP